MNCENDGDRMETEIRLLGMYIHDTSQVLLLETLEELELLENISLIFR
jgi:hypothetical protein